MKKWLGLILVSAFIALSVGREHVARAYPGMMCVNADGCGRCEVCVKESSTAPTGKCMAVAGCH